MSGDNGPDGKERLKGFFAGLASGLTKVAVGHPVSNKLKDLEIATV
jgi:hypothetical protein